MENIIQHLVTEFTAEILEKINTDGGLRDIDKLCSSLKPVCLSYAASIVKEYVRQLNSDIRADKAGRKERGLTIKEHKRTREILTSLGTAANKKVYYFSNKEFLLFLNKSIATINVTASVIGMVSHIASKPKTAGNA